LVICARADCRQLFYLCGRCDRGQRYCARACAARARRATLQDAGRRYQHRRPGRLCHAARQARYRVNCARREKVTHQTSLAPLGSGIVASAPPPSVSPLTGELPPEEATDADPVDGRTPQPGRDPPAGAGRPAPDSQSPLAGRPAPSPRAGDPRRGHRALVRPAPVRCARCGRRGRFVRLTTRWHATVDGLTRTPLVTIDLVIGRPRPPRGSDGLGGLGAFDDVRQLRRWTPWEPQP
jgi:hypothetical protein